MKTIRRLLLAIPLLFAVFEAMTDEWASARDSSTTTNATVVFPGKAGRQAVLRSLDVLADHATAELRLRSAVKSSRIPTAADAGTNVFYATPPVGGVTVPADLIVVIQRTNNVTTWHGFVGVNPLEPYWRVILTTNLATAVGPGDKLWWTTESATNTIGSATVRLQGDLWAASPGSPLMLNLVNHSGTSTRINSATVQFSRYP